MNILITGASGFLGSRLVTYLRTSGFTENHTLWALSSLPVNGCRTIRHLDYHFSAEDITKSGLHHIDCLIHMGSAVPKKREEFGIEYAYKFSTNIIHTAWLLDHLPSIPRKIIYISSVSVYKDDGYLSEKSELQSRDMYGASKLMCESYLTQKSEEMGFDLQILRLGQIYGEGEETYSKIVSSFVKQILAGIPITIYGSGNEIRTMLYVEDCVKYIAHAVGLDCGAGPVNIVGQYEITVRDIAAKIYDSLGISEKIVIQGNKTGTSVTYNSEKMNRYFDIKQIAYDEGIRNYCNYYMERYGGRVS